MRMRMLQMPLEQRLMQQPWERMLAQTLGLQRGQGLVQQQELGPVQVLLLSYRRRPRRRQRVLPIRVICSF